MESIYSFPAWQIAVAFFVLLIAAMEGGRAMGRCLGRQSVDGASGTFMSVVGAVLGVLSLLLGFSYSMAATRYDKHKQLLIHEANAVGTNYLRTSLLSDPARSKMRDLLRELVDAGLARHDGGLDSAQDEEAAIATKRLQAQLWELAAAEARRDPHSLGTAQVVQSVNDLIDASAERTTYFRNHVPEVILWMLILVALISVALVGYAFSKSRERNPTATFVFAAMVAVVVFALIDLDRPRRGLIRAGQYPLRDLREDIQRSG